MCAFALLLAAVFTLNEAPWGAAHEKIARSMNAENHLFPAPQPPQALGPHGTSPDWAAIWQGLDAEVLDHLKSAVQAMPDSDLVAGAKQLPELMQGLKQDKPNTDLLRQRVLAKMQLKTLPPLVLELLRSATLSEPLVAEGAISPVEVLRLKRAEVETRGQLDATTLAIPRAESAIKEVERKIDETRGRFRSEALTELNEARTELSKIQSTGKALEDRVNRTLVTSPVRGIVKQLLVNTIGGVIQPGSDLVEIVPLDDNLLVITSSLHRNFHKWMANRPCEPKDFVDYLLRNELTHFEGSHSTRARQEQRQQKLIHRLELLQARYEGNRLLY